jgi:CheY-like chemotaxis protein
MRHPFESRLTRGPSPLSIIVVAGDPDEDACLVLASALRYAGYRLRLAGTGDELLREARAEDVGLVIAEVDTACADGPCAIEVLKHTPELRHIPVLAYSDPARVISEARALSSGADRFVGDPAHLSNVFEVIALMRQCAREVAEWETALATARKQDHSDGTADADRANAGAMVSRAHRAEKSSGQSPGTAPGTNLDSEREMNYGTARNFLVVELQKDAAAHECGRYDEIGRRFDSIEREIPRDAAPQLRKLRVALAFWDGWIDARNREWPVGGSIDKGEWPMLARRIASDLAQDCEISEARVGARFDPSAGGPTEDRVQTLAARLRVV